MKLRYVLGLALLFSLLVVLSHALYVVRDNEVAVLTRFGQVVNANVAPGLHMLIPLVDDVHKLDARVQLSDGESTTLGTSDHQPLVLDSYVLWRIVDVPKYFAATGGSGHETDALLAPLLRDSLSGLSNGRSLHDLLTGQPPELGSLLPRLDQQARQQLGISVLDLRLRGLHYPDAVLGAVYQRMSTTFNSQADAQRADGKAQADAVLANAERDRRIILADAGRQADALRGEGDGQAAAITTKAVGGDAEFYRFFRSLDTYRNSFSKPGDVLIFRADDDFLRYLKPPAGK